jgi:PAS domain S-box-containing protein
MWLMRNALKQQKSESTHPTKGVRLLSSMLEQSAECFPGGLRSVCADYTDLRSTAARAVLIDPECANCLPPHFEWFTPKLLRWKDRNVHKELPQMTPNPAVLVNVHGTQLLAGDSREDYREKIARITLDSMVQFVGLLDAQGTVLEINHVALDAVGIKLSDVEGKPFWTTFWWQVSEEINLGLRDAIRRAAQGEFVRWDTEIYGRSGGKETIIIDASLMPVKDEQGNVVFITAEGRDITEKKAQEREIARQREELAELDKLKTQFFANISHEFRTPLTLMMGPLEDALGETEGLSAANRDRLELAQRNSVRLLKLVNTLLDFSRIEAGRIHASFEPTDLSLLTAELASVFRSAIERAGMQLKIECPALPEMVYVDREMWEKVVLNLLSNAFKFTFQGEITVSLRAAGSGVELTVRDTGSGIPEDEVSRVFERFHRVQGSHGRSYEGSGIGLALVQELVRLHGGTVQVESTMGVGTAFHVFLLFGRAHLPSEQVGGGRALASTAGRTQACVEEAMRWHAPDRSPRAMDDAMASLGADSASAIAARESSPQTNSVKHSEKVLVVDDNADMCDYLHRLLASQYTVLTAANGEEGLRIARAAHPDLVLTDIMMPVMDGMALLRALRSNEGTQTIPVIFLSARAGEEAGIEGREAGADDYLVKPFSARELLARVAAHMNLARVRREAEARLRESEEGFRAIVETTPECVKVVAADGTLLHMNAAGIAMVGADSLDMVEGKNVYDFVAPEDRESFREFNRRICSGRKGSLEFDIVSLQGVRRRMETHAAPLKNRDGSIVQLAVTRDISARKASGEAARRLAAIVESSDDAIASKDLNGIVTSWNKSAERLFGYKAEEIIGQPVTLIIPVELHPDEPMILAKMRRGERIEHFETVRVTKSGERIEVSLTISPVKDEQGNVIGVAKIVRNITESKKIARALRTTEKLAAAGRLAATVAHEINNPLTAVTNLVYLAKRDAGDAKRVTAHLDLAGRELDRVAHIARQTLGFYRDTSAPIHFNVAETLDDLLLLYETRFQTRKISLAKQYDKEVEITALAGEIRQALSNLVSNALDAMPEGGTLHLRVSKSQAWTNPELPGVRITIVDTGSGIAPRHRASLFQPFFTTKADVGTGLGLWITRNIVEKHGGSIRLRTRTGPREHGTAFSIFLPLHGKPPVPGMDVVSNAPAESAIPSGVGQA